MQISFRVVEVEAANRFYLNMPFTTYHHSKYTLITGCPHTRKTQGPQHMPTEGLFVCLLQILSDSLTWQKPLMINNIQITKCQNTASSCNCTVRMPNARWVRSACPHWVHRGRLQSALFFHVVHTTCWPGQSYLHSFLERIEDIHHGR